MLSGSRLTQLAPATSMVAPAIRGQNDRVASAEPLRCDLR
jgi:hypothetical protein